jgi:hypothetical protein
MSIKFRSTELSSAEASFLKWQYGFDEEDEPFERALWQAIQRAWEAEVALYLQFKSDDSDEAWNQLIRRAALSDRRTAKVDTSVNRRRSH